jgi:hypothetical protein
MEDCHGHRTTVFLFTGLVSLPPAYAAKEEAKFWEKKQHLALLVCATFG